MGYLDDDPYPVWACCSICMVKSITYSRCVISYPWLLDGEAYLITGLLFPY